MYMSNVVGEAGSVALCCSPATARRRRPPAASPGRRLRGAANFTGSVNINHDYIHINLKHDKTLYSLCVSNLL